MSSASRQVGTPGVAVKFISAGLAGCVAETATIPIDTAKVRLQVDSHPAATERCTHSYGHSVTLLTSPPNKYVGPPYRQAYKSGDKSVVRLCGSLYRTVVHDDAKLRSYERGRSLQSQTAFLLRFSVFLK